MTSEREEREIIILVGSPGSGKSTYFEGTLGSAKYVRISQDDQGKAGHLELFKRAIDRGLNVVVDRMNFNKNQRDRYLIPAKEAGYKTKIIVFHVPQATCLQRCIERKDHPTIKDEPNVPVAKTASKAIHFFFRNYERVQDSEADEVVRLGWDGPKKAAVVCDLDSTLCDLTHRHHFVMGPEKKNWKAFFDGISGDKIYPDVHRIIDEQYFNMCKSVILCSGRPDEYRGVTTTWLENHNVVYTKLLMRERGDHRQDNIVKSNIYEFDIKPLYDVHFVLDDRKQVVDAWRSLGLTCLQVRDGDF